jgi:hypothetical protein
MSEDINYGYGVTENTSDVSGGGSIPPGINEDVTFVKATFERLTDDEDKDSLLMLYFEKDGGSLRHLIWPIDVERVKQNYEIYPPKESRRDVPHLNLKKGDTPTVAQQIGLRFDEFNTRIKHILNAFLKDDKKSQTGVVSNYEHLSQVVIEKLTPFFGTQIRLKVVLNDKGYSTTPDYGPFVESNVPIGDSKLKIGPKDIVSVTQRPSGGLPQASGMSAPPAPGIPSSAPPPPPPPPGSAG